MKALSILLFATLVLAGCASPQMKEDDAFLWGDHDQNATNVGNASGAATQVFGK